MRYRLLSLPLLACAILRCSGGESTPGTPILANNDSGTPSDGGTVTMPTPGAGDCGRDKICFDLDNDVEAGANAFRVAVYWYQLNDDGPDPTPQTTYDVAVPAGAKSFEINLSDVPAPSDEKLLVCDRATDDEAVSPCLSDPKIGYAVVVAYRDSNGDGKFAQQGTAGDQDTVVGIGDVVVGYSAMTYDGTNWPGPLAQDWGRSWPTGIEAGVHVYQIDRPEGGSFDRPVKSNPGTRNKIRLKGPNLT